MMKRKAGFGRLLASIWLTAAVAVMAGCSASQTIGLSALVPAKDQGQAHEEEVMEGDAGSASEWVVNEDGESDGATAIYIPESGASEQELVSQHADEITDTAVPAPEPNPGNSSDGTDEAAHDFKDRKLAALTFDDGPDAKYTTAILDILKEKGVKATFFVVGTQVEKYPDVMKRIEDEGHAIGNHTQAHKNMRELGRTGILQQITEADEAIEQAVGEAPSLFRAPYGAISDTLLGVLEEKDRRLIGWTVDTRDWAGTSIPDMREMIRTKTEANGIILMHSFGGKHIRNTVEMLPDVIDDLQELGFTLVTVDQIEE